MRGCSVSGLDTVRITELTGHADDALVRAGGVVTLKGWVVMERMKLLILVAGGCLGGLLMLGVILLGVCARWRPVVMSLHRSFLAIARAVVNHDGEAGTTMDPMVWSAGAHPKRRRLVHAVRDRAFLPGPLGIWDAECVHVLASAFCG